MRGKMIGAYNLPSVIEQLLRRAAGLIRNGVGFDK